MEGEGERKRRRMGERGEYKKEEREVGNKGKSEDVGRGMDGENNG